MERGKLIIVEGIDGAGKSTVINNLTRVLTAHNIDHMRTSEPFEGCQTGKLIRRILKHEVPFPGKDIMAQLFALAHFIHTHTINTYLEKGVTVLCDRYIYSNFTYNTGSMEEVTELLQLYQNVSITPDIVIWLDIPVYVAMDRMTTRSPASEFYEKQSTLLDVDKRYREMFCTPVGRFSLYAPILYCVNVVLIDATQPPEAITERLTDIILKTYFQRKNNTMSRKRIICLDFDGVCHLYSSGWKGIDVIPDSPVDGLFPWLLEASQHFDIHIFSSRSEQFEGLEAMKRWFMKYAGKHSNTEWETISSRINNTLFFYRKVDGFLMLTLHFPTTKPPAHYTLDDRAERFDGHFPLVQHIIDFQPWHKVENTFPEEEGLKKVSGPRYTRNQDGGIEYL